MAYIKLEDQGETTETAQENTAESDFVDFMVSVSTITEHCDAIRKMLRTLPISTSRQIAEAKLKEVQMWSHEAFSSTDQ